MKRRTERPKGFGNMVRKFTPMAITATLLAALFSGLGTASAKADIIPGFPDGIVCTLTQGVLGPRIYYLIADEDRGASRDIRYRIPRAGTNFDFVFDETGAYVSDTQPETTTCDNQSIQSIVATGNSFVFMGNAGDAVPAGALIAIDAAACPGGWTRQLQVRGSGTPDTGVIVCRKD